MLTDAKIKAAKPSGKPYKLADGDGLYLLIKGSGSRLWRFKYRYAGKEKLAAFGGYQPGSPDHVSLAEARDRLAGVKRQLRDGIDPSAARQVEKQARVDRAEGAFEVVALEWHAKQSAAWSPGYAEKELRQLKSHVFPRIGGKPVRDLTSRDLLDVLQRIEKKGRAETAHRVRRSLGAIMRYAVLTHRADVDPSAALKGALAPVPGNHFAAITEPKKVGELLRAISGYEGSAVTCCALRLAPLTFVRPGELRGARWEECEFDLTDPAPGKEPRHPQPQWRILPERMKMGEQHIVPLSRQSVAVLRELHAITGPSGYLFPSVRSKARCMSENTINAALRGMGFAQDEMTGHGFRHMASTLLHERGYRSEWIERQLAHGDRNSVRARYNFAEHLPDRRRMMQEWADYLDGLASGAKLVNIKAGKKKA
jgi:integrase